MTPMARGDSAAMAGQVVGVAHLDAVHPLADDGRIGVQQGHDVEVAGGEPLGPGQGPTQVPDAGDDHPPHPVQSQLAVDLLDEEGGVVPRPPGPERAEQRQVLAHLGRVDPGRGGQELGRDRGRTRPEQLLEDALVDGEAGHRGLGDPAGPGPEAPGSGSGCRGRGAAGHGSDRRTREVTAESRMGSGSPDPQPRGGPASGSTAPMSARMRTAAPGPGSPSTRAADARSSTRDTSPLASSSSPNSPGSSSPEGPHPPGQRPSGPRPLLPRARRRR